MKMIPAVLGWTLRASAAICMTWIIVQVATGQISSLPVLLGSVAWHAAFALGGVALVGASKRASDPAL
ncbi:MAG TPA: hypothetical protein VFG89_07845 [Coriobacteriia bacterium]|nr:hypothetical protein [Coriobacteriia bacterium]